MRTHYFKRNYNHHYDQESGFLIQSIRIIGLMDAHFILPVCPEGQDFCNLEAGVYYEFSSGTASWENAKLACESNGGSLAILDTQEKFDWMYGVRASHATNDPSMSHS